MRISEFKKTASEAMTNNYRVKKTNYRITNWAEYDQALVNRGDVMVWFDQAYLENNWVAKRGMLQKPFNYHELKEMVQLALS